MDNTIESKNVSLLSTLPAQLKLEIIHAINYTGIPHNI